MALIPISNTDGTITIDCAPSLVWPPPFIFGVGYGNLFVSHAATFDFTPLFDLGRRASVQYFTYDISVNAHDWAEVNGDFLQITPPSGPTIVWGGAGAIHTPPPDPSYYGIAGPSQPFDDDLKSGPTDTSPSPGFSYSRYFADSNHGGFSNPVPVLSRCGITSTFFTMGFALQYWHASQSNLAYATHATAPVITISNLKAWVEVFEPWNCADDCGGPTSIASGHDASVCLQAVWVKDSELPNGGSGGLIRPPGQFAGISWDTISTSACTLHVTIGCLTAEQIAAAHFAGPYRIAIISSDHCTFSGVGYTRVYYADFSVTADVECGHTDDITGNPFCLEDKHGRYHVTGTSGAGSAVQYRRSNFGTPVALGWDVASKITAPAGTTLHDPRVIVDDRQSVRLAYARQVTSGGAWTGVFIADSNDDGFTWEASVLAITGGHSPTIAIGQDGTFDIVVLAAYNSGAITAMIQGAGDAAFGSPFNFKDSAGADLAVVNETFHVQQARDDQSRWMLHVLISGDAATSQWTSYDECRTFERVA